MTNLQQRRNLQKTLQNIITKLNSDRTEKLSQENLDQAFKMFEEFSMLLSDAICNPNDADLEKEAEAKKLQVIKKFIEDLSDDLLFDDMQAQYAPTTIRKNNSFEDDWTLFYQEWNICLYNYYWQDREIKSSEIQLFNNYCQSIMPTLQERLQNFISQQ